MNKYQNIADREVRRISELDEKRNVVDNRLQHLRNNLSRTAMEWAMGEDDLVTLKAQLNRIFNLPIYGGYKDKRMITAAMALGNELRAKYRLNKRNLGKKYAEAKIVQDTYNSSHVKAMNRLKYKAGNRFESKRKEKEWDNLLSSSRNQVVPIIFYLSSTHTKPAKDHAAWQGKMYVDEKWESILRGAEINEFEIKKVRQYIQKNNIRTVQWVLGAPVYLIYRPFCKHFLVPIPTKKALDTPPTKWAYRARQLDTSGLEDRKNRQGNGTRREINAREHEKRLQFVDGLSKSQGLPETTKQAVNHLKRRELSAYMYWKNKR